MEIIIKDAWYDSQDHKVRTAIIDIPSLGYRNIPYTVSDYDPCDSELHTELIALLEKYDIREYSGKIVTPEEELAIKIRCERNMLLDRTDKYMTIDYPISDKEKEALKQYRQSLRDIPQQKGFPNNVEWPEKPSIKD